MTREIFIQSCHASLEYDEARMFVDLGYKVAGEFDVGSNQRRKLHGITDINSNLDDFNLIVLHQVPEYSIVMERLLKAGKRVILVSFGQADRWQYQNVGELCRRFQYAYVAPYSKKDEQLHIKNGAPASKVRMIRFGKYLEDFKPWIGDGQFIYASCNSIHKRGKGCGWEYMERCLKEVPLVLSGKDTQEVGGLGEITEEEMRSRYRHAAGFLSFGTVPAVMVLTQIEAWCAGCPTIIHDNFHGITNEGFRGFVRNPVDNLIEECRRLLADENYRAERHQDSLANAHHFDIKTVGPQWRDLIEEVCA